MSSTPLCPICTHPTTLHDPGTTTPEDFFNQPTGYHIAAGSAQTKLPLYRCQTCGHAFTPLNIPDSAISNWYAKSPEDKTFLQDEEARRKTAHQILKYLAQYKKPPGNLLDIGAGPGFFISEAQKQGWQVQGIEPAQWATTHGQQTLQLSGLKHGTIQDIKNYPAQSCDVVTSFDVIEHLPHPEELITATSHLLKPGGIFLLTTPAFDSLLSKVTGKKWHAIFPAHIHLFSRASLENLLTKHGFKIEKVKIHTRYLSATYFWHRLRSYLNPNFNKPLPQGKSFLLPINFADEYEIYARK